MNDKQKDMLKAEIRKLITGEFKDQLKEVSATGAVTGYQTPMAFSSRKSSIGNTKAATAGLGGYKVVGNIGKTNNEESLQESNDYNVKADYDAMVAKLKTADYAIENELKNKLKKSLVGKKVTIHGSKGYKQFKKDYEVEVVDVKIEDYYGNYEVILVGKDNKEYFVDRNFKVNVVGQAAPQGTPTNQTPAETEVPEQPEQPEQPDQNAQKPVSKAAQKVPQQPVTKAPQPSDGKKQEEPVEPEGTTPKTDLSKELKK